MKAEKFVGGRQAEKDKGFIQLQKLGTLL